MPGKLKALANPQAARALTPSAAEDRPGARLARYVPNRHQVIPSAQSPDKQPLMQPS